MSISGVTRLHETSVNAHRKILIDKNIDGCLRTKRYVSAYVAVMLITRETRLYLPNPKVLVLEGNCGLYNYKYNGGSN